MSTFVRSPENSRVIFSKLLKLQIDLVNPQLTNSNRSISKEINFGQNTNTWRCPPQTHTYQAGESPLSSILPTVEHLIFLTEFVFFFGGGRGRAQGFNYLKFQNAKSKFYWMLRLRKRDQ